MLCEDDYVIVAEINIIYYYIKYEMFTLQKSNTIKFLRM